MKRITTAKNQLESYKGWLSKALNGEKFKTERCSVSYRKSKAVEVADLDALLAFDVIGEYIKIAAPEPRKTAIKEAIEAGKEIPGCSIAEKVSVILK